jgi:hypothetical protein
LVGNAQELARIANAEAAIGERARDPTCLSCCLLGQAFGTFSCRCERSHAFLNFPRDVNLLFQFCCRCRLFIVEAQC